MARPKRTAKSAPTGDASNVFIAWGGEKSEIVAEGLAKWLPKLIDSVRPWMSKQNIRSGTAWFPTIMSQLEQTEFGIVCLTPDNLENRWIHFEAGAIAKRVSEDARVTPYLVGIVSRQVTSPFNALQHREAKKEPTFELLLDINRATGANVDAKVLSERFEKFWPELEEVLTEAEAVHATTPKPPPTGEMVEEILGIVRALGADVARSIQLGERAMFLAQGLVPESITPIPGGAQGAQGPSGPTGLGGNSLSNFAAALELERLVNLLQTKKTGEWTDEEIFRLLTRHDELPGQWRRVAEKVLRQSGRF